MPPLEVRPHPTKHRALHTTTPLPPSTPITTFTPLLQLPSLTHLTRVCTHCLRPGTPRACTRCQAAYYCDAACQAAAWKSLHRRECKALQRVGRPVPTPVRALMLVLLDGEVRKGVEALDGNVSAWRRGGRWRDMEVMAMGACGFAGTGTGEKEVKEALELLCKIQTNAFHRFDLDLGDVAIFLEPTLAMANHSCIPNATVQFVGRRAILRAERHIKAGDEIEISYTDYTHPLSMRREALASYNFVCQCARCQDDLNVYQVCAASPLVDLNSQSLVSDLSTLKRHPAAMDDKKVALIKQDSTSLTPLIESKELSDSPDQRRRELKSQYQQCQPLIVEELWAVAPLPHILSEISILYSEEGNFSYALAIACLVATACDPYRYPAPFHSVRIKGLYMIAKLLANTAAEEAELASSMHPVAPKGTLAHQAVEVLREIDQVSLCQMLLIMVSKSVPEGDLADWEIIRSAKELLQDISQLQGREKELSLINAWSKTPADPASRPFFEFAVLRQIDALASLGREVLRVDFKI